MVVNLAQRTTQTSTTAELCQNVAQVSNTPGGYSIFYDNDPTFVYSPDNCTNTNQKFIDIFWYGSDCEAAIEAACGSTSNVSTALGSWTFGWHQTSGAACQAAIYSPFSLATADGAGLLDTSCCIRNFRAAVDSLTHLIVPVFSYHTNNRASINIAPGGFPFTKDQSDEDLQTDANGMQVDATLPSYILQGIPPPYPYSSRNCTAADIRS